MTIEQNYENTTGTLVVHLADLNTIARRASVVLCMLCIFWSFSADHIISAWLDYIPLQTGPNNENISVYGPFAWIQMRWSVVILLSIVTMMPMLSIQIYKFARSGLYPLERNWFTAVLFLTTTMVPVSIIIIWAFGLPALFEFTRISGNPEGVLVRYDAASIFSLGIGATWLLVVWSVTTITLCLSRIYGMVSSGKTRFRNRLLVISSGTLILTLPLEYDGLKIIIAIISVVISDALSNTIPVRQHIGPLM